MIFWHNTVQIYHNTAIMSEISRDAYFVWGWAKWFAKVSITDEIFAHLDVLPSAGQDIVQTHYVSLSSWPVLLVAVETLELLGGPMGFLVEFQGAQSRIALPTDVAVVDFLTPGGEIVKI